jgi:hypothetical protein
MLGINLSLKMILEGTYTDIPSLEKSLADNQKLMHLLKTNPNKFLNHQAELEKLENESKWIIRALEKAKGTAIGTHS